MRNTRYTTALAGLFAAALLGLSCSNIFSPGQTGSPGPAGGGSAALVIDINLPADAQASSLSGARTLLPSNLNGLVKSYSAQLTKSGSDTIDVAAASATLTVADLAQGSWTVVVSAKNLGGDIMASGTGTAVIGASKQYRQTILLAWNPAVAGSGGAAVTVSFPATVGVTAVDGKFDADADWASLSILTPTSPKVLLTRSGVTAGTPLLQLRFKKGSTILSYYSDRVWIFANGTTTVSKALSVADFGSAPRAPYDLRAVAKGGGKIDLSWTSGSSTADNFILRRSTASGSGYVDIATPAVSLSSYSDTTIPLSGTPIAGDSRNYYYRLVAVNRFGESAVASSGVYYDACVDIDAAALAVAPDALDPGLGNGTFQIDFALAGRGANATTVAWSSSATAVVAPSAAPAMDGKVYAIVYRPVSTGADASVTLTATVRKGNATAIRTLAAITVKKSPGPDWDLVLADKKALAVGYAGSDTEASVTQSVTVPTSVSANTTLSWTTSDATSLTTVGTATRKADDDYGVALRAKLESTAHPGDADYVDYKKFVLLVKISDQGAVDKASAVTAPDYAWLDDATSVTRNVGLASTEIYQTNLAWSAALSPAISDAGLVTRPAVSDAAATLTATITKNAATATKAFPVTVKADLVAPTAGGAISAESIAATSMELYWGEATDDVTPQQLLKYKVVRAASTASIDTIGEADAVTGAALLQDWTADATHLALSGLTDSLSYAFAILVKDAVGNLSLYAPISATTRSVLTITGSSGNPTAQTLLIYNASNAQQTDFTLAVGASLALHTDLAGSSYAWSVDGGTFASAATCVLVANDSGLGKHELLVEVQKDGLWYSGNATFTVAIARTDAQILAAALTALSIVYANGDSGLGVTQNLGLATTGANGATIAWSSDRPTIIATNGTVTKPASIDTQVTLSAVVSAGSESASKTFLVKVLSSANATAILAADKAALAIGYQSGDSFSSVTKNLSLPATAPNGSAVSWALTSGTAVTAGGVTTRPGLAAGDASVRLTATLSKSGASDTRAFDLTVIKQTGIYFDANGGSGSMGAQTIANGTSANLSANASSISKAGYSLAGWATTAGGSVAYTDGASYTMASAVPVTLYAKWSVTVSYDSQSATTAASPTSAAVILPATTVGSLPTAPAKTGYSFGGWWTQAGGGGSQFLAATAVGASLTVYAKWTATVSYDSQSATTAASPTSAAVTLPATTVGSLPTAPAKTGYSFGGWYTATGGGGSEFLASTTVGASLSVYAKWTATVSYDSQSATTAASPTSAAVTLPATTVGSLPTDPARTGYSFGGWWTQAGGGGSQFLADSTVSASLSVYAKWTGNSYTVTLDGQGMTPSPSSITVTYGSTYASLPTPSNGSYTFGGWWTGTSGSGSQVTTASTVSITASQTLYALWTLVEARIYPSTTSANMQNGSWAPANATDGDANTYWSTSASANYGTAALYANLSSVKYVTKVMIHWEAGPQTWNLLSVASGGSQGNGAWLTIPVNQNWQNFELDIAGSNGSNGASVYDFQVWGY